MTYEGELVGILGRLVESRATNTVLNFALPVDAQLVPLTVREGVPPVVYASRVMRSMPDHDSRVFPIERALSETLRCGTCNNLTDRDPCVLCADPERQTDRTR